jgi:hypothetical protein
MGTRQRLNLAFASGSLVLAALVGVLTSSWAVFFIVLGLALAANVPLQREIR